MDDAGLSETACVVVGGGPAGAVLALLLGRQGVDVTVLEKHTDLDRSFRGNTLNPAVLELLDALGLAEAVHALPHAKTTHFTAIDAGGEVRFADFAALETPFPYVLLTQQAHVLRLLFGAAERTGRVRLVTGADVQGLVEEDGAVCGVTYERAGERHTLRASLVVACDGRHSAVRERAGLVPKRLGVPIDVLWMALPRRPEDDAHAGALFRFGPGAMVALMDAFDHWQLGLVIPKDSFEAVRARGLAAFRERLAALVPMLADRIGALEDWRQVALLRVEVSRLRRWHRPGLLLLGDAAHAMSPVGMVGINLAIQDAACAAEVLAPALREGRVPEEALRAVQRRREPWVRRVQAAQALVHRRVLARALRSDATPRLPQPERWAVQQPLLLRQVTHLIAYGRLGRRPAYLGP